MPPLEVRNWFGELVSHPKALVEVNSDKDVVAALQDPDPNRCPKPVRALGSGHSPTPCGMTGEGGTILRMSGMNRILNITADTVTAEAGARYIDVARQLLDKGLQFHVNTEFGNLSLGSAACAGTKDASMPGEFGSVGSYVTGVKMILPSGKPRDVTEDQEPEVMKAIRSSYGLFGIIHEVTMQVRPIQPLRFYHETFSLEDFIAQLPKLKGRNQSMFFYLFPFAGKITVEFRHYNPGATGGPNREIWKLRNNLWKEGIPTSCYDLDKPTRVETTLHLPHVNYAAIDLTLAGLRETLTKEFHSDNTLAPDQMIEYPASPAAHQYRFSFWAFPEEKYPQVLADYFQFCRQYYETNGYRCNMLNLGYRVTQDQNALLSYAHDGPVMTIDPATAGLNPKWLTFLQAYNEFASEREGIPLLNQTPCLTRDQVRKAFGDRLPQFEQIRRSFDPEGRLLNDYFADLLSE